MTLALLCGLALAVTATGCKQNSAPRSDAGAASRSETSNRDGGARDARTCPADARKAKGKAEACSCDNECRSGFCVDGVCCSSACGETCKACNLPNSLGDCAFVPAGGSSAHQECEANTPASCGLDGTCDGKGTCRKYVKGTECRAGTCDGDGIAGALACDGKGACSESLITACAPYTCDKSKNRCTTRCTTHAQCADGQTCAAGRCGDSANGASCETGTDCASGFCVDGVCCNVACSGPCVSCNQTGFVGRCQYIPADLPDPDCNAQAASTCGNSGLCDGRGFCTLYPADTVCAPSSCSGLTETPPRTCDGKGVCREPATTIDCAPFICGNGACTTTCDTNDPNTCDKDHACVASDSGNICGKRKNGQSCPDSSQCESGFCVDGVCCENSCTGACRTCNSARSPGKCTNVAAGSDDPHHSCSDKGTAACSTNGKCDGNGGCQKYPQGTSCGSPSCSDGEFTPAATCNASGKCVPSQSQTCAPFICNGSVCHDACTGDDQCVAGSYCVNGSCGLKPLGANCSAGTDCASGECAQGVCCNSKCADACMACNLTNSQGTCTAVADGTPDPQGICENRAASTCGTTGACLAGQCAFYEKGISCKAAECATTSSLKPAYTCDGAGACTEPEVISCGSYVCADASCKTTCEREEDCVDAVCIQGSCGRKADGAACTYSAQCVSRHCETTSSGDRMCCATACTADEACVAGECKEVDTCDAGADSGC